MKRSNRKQILYLVIVISFVFYGCATSRTSRVETKTTANPDIAGNEGYVVGGKTTTVIEENGTPEVKRTEVKEETVRENDRGVVGSVFYFIGQVIAFPFKLIAGIFNAVF